MAKASPIKTNFTSGEISPKVYGRIDTARYQNGAGILENFMVRPQGGISRRSGTNRVGPAFRNSYVSRLIPFRAAETQSYILEFSRGMIRIIRNGRVLMRTDIHQVVSSIANSSGEIELTSLSSLSESVGQSYTNGSGGVRVNLLDVNFQGQAIYRAHGFRNGDRVNISGHSEASVNGSWVVTVVDNYQFDLNGLAFVGNGASGTLETNGVQAGDYITLSGSVGSAVINGEWIVKSATAYNKMVLANSTYVNSYTGNSAIAYTRPVSIMRNQYPALAVDVPYLDTDLDDIKYCQSADVMYLFHPSYPTYKIMRFSNDLWVMQQVNFKDGPYLPLNSMAPTINPNDATTGTIVSDVYLQVTGYTHVASFTSATDLDLSPTDVGKFFEFKDGEQFRLASVLTIAGGLKSGTCSVYDNILIYLDERDKLTGTVDVWGNAVGDRGGGGGYQPSGSTDQSPTNALGGQGLTHKMDPITILIGDTTINASHGGTFTQFDINKYVRHYNTVATGYRWGLITKVNSSTQVVANAALTMVSNTATGLFDVYDHVRIATVTSYRKGAVFALFASTDIGRSIRLSYKGKITWGKITAYTSTSVVTVQFYEDVPTDGHDNTKLASNGKTYEWRLGAWSGTTGYPSCGCFHEQRLCCGRTNTEPQTLWMSRGGDFENMAPTFPDSTVGDDSAITYTIISSEINPIKWMASGPVLLIGGLGEEWQVRSSSAISEPITPTNVSVTQQGQYGSLSTAQPRRIGHAAIFVDRAGRKVRELTYDFQLDAFVSHDVSIISEHLFRLSRAKITEYQEDPHSILWVLRFDGTLAGMTYDKDQEVVAWHRQAITSGTIKSIAVIPSISGSDDVLYMVVQRTINGTVQQTIEYLGAEFTPVSVSDRTGMIFVDEAVQMSFTSRTVINGLNHLEGAVVSAVNQSGTDLGDFTVASGSITLSAAVTGVTVGLGFTSLLRTLPPEAGGVIGTSQMKTKRVNKFGVRVYDSLTLKHGYDNVNYQTEVLGTTFFTGDKVFSLTMPHNLQGEIYIKQDRPYPLNITAMSPELKTFEEGVDN
jgi:hypothetical protein